jgi:hypothetical protein
MVRPVPASTAYRDRTHSGSPEPDVEYLDLDGDGILDAVRITETRARRYAPDGREELVQVIVELDAGIGDDGVPATTERTETLEIQLGSHDGDLATPVVAGASQAQ